MIISYSLDTL